MPQLMIDELAQAKVEGRKPRLSADKILQIISMYRGTKR